jgi:hypothetical protein
MGPDSIAMTYYANGDLDEITHTNGLLSKHV